MPVNSEFKLMIPLPPKREKNYSVKTAFFYQPDTFSKFPFFLKYWILISSYRKIRKLDKSVMFIVKVSLRF